MSRLRQQGFMLIELLIVLAVIGVLAAISIPNLLNAVQRGRQRRTMSDMRALATAVESYGADNNGYVPAAAGPVSSIAVFIEPTYIQRLPVRDAWKTDIVYVAESQEYTIFSYGKDKTVGGGGSVSPTGATTDFENDIIMTTGSFVEFPDGVQN
jgi:general secretion pathway protein G